MLMEFIIRPPHKDYKLVQYVFTCMHNTTLASLSTPHFIHMCIPSYVTNLSLSNVQRLRLPTWFTCLGNSEQLSFLTYLTTTSVQAFSAPRTSLDYSASLLPYPVAVTGPLWPAKVPMVNWYMQTVAVRTYRDVHSLYWMKEVEYKGEKGLISWLRYV